MARPGVRAGSGQLQTAGWNALKLLKKRPETGTGGRGRWPVLLALAVLSGLLLAASGCRWLHSGPPPGVAARVNGADITMAALNRAVARQTGGRKLGSSQLAQLQMALLAQMVDQEVALQYAHHLGIVAPATALETELHVAQIRDPQEAVARVRRRLARQWVLARLFAREIGPVQISSAEVAAYFHAHPGQFNVAEPNYHVREILVATHPPPGPRNPGAPAFTMARARQRLKLIRAALQSGTPFATVAREYSDSMATAESGGDLGMIPESALSAETPGALRQALLLLQPGQVSPPVATARGFYFLQLVGKEIPGSQKLSDPAVRARIVTILTGQRQQTLKTALMTVLRDRAHVENFLAERLLKQAKNNSKR